MTKYREVEPPYFRGEAPTAPRIPTLDLIRGVAVLGILAINIAGFAGPPQAVLTPASPDPAWARADSLVYAAGLVLFEGKMRALFSVLFGASLELFVARAEAAGRDGQAMQLRRLLWLAGFGYLHFALLWWGDILFDYAVAGVAALALRQAPGKLLVAAALLIFAGWQLSSALDDLPLALAEARVAGGTASVDDTRAVAHARRDDSRDAAADLAEARAGLAAQAAVKLAERPFDPVSGAWDEFGEALAYMLLGVALLRSGFFGGGFSGRGWPRARLRAAALGGIGLGGAATVWFAVWAARHGYPPGAMRLAIGEGLSFAHLAMAIGYAAALVLAAPRVLATALGRRLAAAGRMALSNYLGTSLVMTALFYGWGLGLVGRVGSAGQAGFVLLGWAMMIGWSAPWLSRFRQGPLEWLWRSLTEWRRLPLRKAL